MVEILPTFNLLSIYGSMFFQFILAKEFYEWIQFSKKDKFDVNLR
jgi:hypothetical protein